MDTRLRPVWNKLRRRETFTYVAFGDSHTYGARCDGWCATFGINGASSGPPSLAWNSFSNLFARYLQSVNPNVNYVNSGNPGYTANKALTVVQAQVVDQNPDLVVMEFALNDCYTSEGLSTFQSAYQSLIDTITQNTNATLICFTPTPAADATNAYGWQGTPLAQPVIPLVQYIEVTQELAASNNLVLVDNYEMFLEQYYLGFTAKYWLMDYTGATDLGAEHAGELGHKMYYHNLKKVFSGLRVI